MPPDEPAPQDEEMLDERLSRPSAALRAALARAPGDLLVLGAGGKMGPSLVRLAQRTDPSRRIVAVSRWSNPDAAAALRRQGVETERADLTDPRALARLPDAPNVVFMAGQKFGTARAPSLTWLMNAGVPAFVAERFAGARTVVFSTGNVYPRTLPSSGGAREDTEPAPVGEYAYSCLARERLFAAASARHGTPVALVRLNYAHDLRYGVLTDLARRILGRQRIDLRMGFVNVIWQGDANAVALAALACATTPHPRIVNVAGRETLAVRSLAEALGARLGVEPLFDNEPAADALLSDASRMAEVLDTPLLPVETLLGWVAEWIARGRRVLGAPTHYEERDGRF